MERKGEFIIVTDESLLPKTCEYVDVGSFFTKETDYNEHNIMVNFERSMLLAKAYNQSAIIFNVKMNPFSLKSYDKIVHIGKKVIESFISEYRLRVYFVLIPNNA